MKTPGIHLAALLSLACVFVAPAAGAQVFSDAKVQSPELSPPQRGSVAGQLASVAFGAGDVSRGAFSLPSAFALPSDRAPLLASPFPTYSPEAGLSEWGAGWRSSVSITRGRWLGDLDYQTDDLESPWGRLVRGNDGYYYPLGLSSPIRVEAIGDTLIGYAPNGNRWTFGGAARVTTASGTYSWFLTSVVAPTGQTTTFTYDTNDSGHLFVHTVRAASLASNAWVEAELQYDILPTSLVDERSGSALTLDRRVRAVIVSQPDALTGAPAERWRYGLTYLQDSVGPGYYLQAVTQRFASGESAPAMTYTYGLVAEHLASEAARRVPKLDALATSFSTDVVDSSRSTPVDMDDDGRADLEWSLDNRLLVQGDDGFTSQPLDVAGPNADPFCRHAPSGSNGVRNLVRLRRDESAYRVLNLQPGSAITVMRICTREGDPILKTNLNGIWTLGPLTKLVDVNRDRQPDLIRAFFGGVEVLPNISSADGYAFGEPIRTLLQPAIQANAAWAQDMNGDGIPDLVSRNGTDIIVWRGKGHFAFEPQGQIFHFFDGQIQVSNLGSYEMTWVDANKDGLTDVLLAKGGTGYLFFNTGSHFKRVAVPALHAKPISTTRLIPVDLAGTGNTELVYIYQQQGYAIALDDASTGLLARADDGRGTALHFTYGRAPAAAGIRHRPSVLQRLEVTSTGSDTTSYEYGYAEPVLHTAAQALIGFGQVTRRAPLATDTMTFLNEDRYSGVLLSSMTHDDLVPGIDKVEYRQYQDVTSFGIDWKRLSRKGQGYSSTDPLRPAVALDGTEVTAYEAEVCAKSVVETTPHGTLQTVHHRLELALLAKHLTCLDDTTVQTGAHANPALDFRHALATTRNDAGQITFTQLVGAAETLDQQSVTYTASGNVASIASPGHGIVTFDYDPQTDALSRIIGADGVTTEVTDRDPTTGALRALRVDRGGPAFVQGFRYDGQERLARSWNNLGGASEALPNESLAYRYASGTLPALIQSATLVSAQGGTYARAAEVFSARGEALAKVHRIPEGWAFDALTQTHSQTRSTTSLSRAPSPVDVSALTVDALYAGAAATHAAQGSLFGVPVADSMKLHADVQRDVATALSIDDGLTRTDVENGLLSTSTTLDPAQRPTSFRDAAGHFTRYTYDALGRVRRVSLADGARHGVDYDEFGRPRRVDRDAVASVVYTYAPTTGLLAERRFLAAPGSAQAGTPMRSVRYTYDEIGRVARETHVDEASGATQEFAYLYDGARPDTPGDRTERGLLTAVVGDRYIKTLRHRQDGQETQRTVRIADWRSVEANTVYDDGGVRERTVIVRDGVGTELTRDTEALARDGYGRVISATRDGAPFATYAYDVRGLPLWASFDGAYGHGEIVTLTHDPLTQRRVGLNQHSSAWAAAVSRRMNARGLVDSEDVSVSALNRHRDFQYTPEGYLAQSSDTDATYAYEYAPGGLPSRIVSTISGVADDRMFERSGSTLTAGSHHHTFDDLGRAIERDDVELTYGPNGQVTSARRGPREWRYLYDEGGARIAKLGSDGVAESVYLADGSVIDASAVTTPIHYAGQVVGVLVTAVEGVGSKQFQMVAADLLGTALSDKDGTPRVASPFGDRATHPDVTGALDYATKGWDADLGVVRMGVRDYDTTTSRFTTPDPLFLEQPQGCVASPTECALYGYAKNVPNLYTDPSGQCVDGCVIESAVVAGGAFMFFAASAYLTLPENQRSLSVAISAGNRGAGDAVDSVMELGKRALTAGVAAWAAQKSASVVSRFGAETRYVFATYTVKLADGSVYSGRTSTLLKAGENEREGAKRAVDARWDRHHMAGSEAPGARAMLDAFAGGSLRKENLLADGSAAAMNYAAIRGREQQLIDANHGARSHGGTSGNAIRGVATDNELRGTYDAAATGMLTPTFGPARPGM